MATHIEPETGPAEQNRLEKWSALDVFDDVRLAEVEKPAPHGSDQVGIALADTITATSVRSEGLAWRGGMDDVEIPVIPLRRIGSDEAKRVVRLRIDVDPDDLEASTPVAEAGPASTTVQIQQSWPHVTLVV